MEQQEQPNAVQLPMTPEATSAVLAVRYAVDAEFRAAFDKDPKAAIAEMSGEELPSDLEIVVHRNEDKCWHLTLPAQEAGGALGDEDIENVAGGFAGAVIASGLAAATPAICANACTGLNIAPDFAEMGVITAAVTVPTRISGRFGGQAYIDHTNKGSGG